MCKRARENAKQKNRIYDLEPEYIRGLLEKQRYRCAVTHIELYLTGERRCPWAPSLDQIMPGAGYTENNVRVVAMIVNTAMNGWGAEVLLDFLSRVGLRSSFGALPLSTAASTAPKLEELLD
jgi:hypothetical protein